MSEDCIALKQINIHIRYPFKYKLIILYLPITLFSMIPSTLNSLVSISQCFLFSDLDFMNVLC